MAFAKGTGHSLRYVQEENFGITPPDGVMTQARITSCSIILNKNSFQSNEIRTDAQISDLRHGVKQATGDIGFELSYGAFDAFLAAAVRGSWQNDALVAGTVTPTFTFERAFEDINQFQVFTGCAVNTLSLSIQSDAMITGTLGIIGKGSEFVNQPLANEVLPSPMRSPLDGFHGELKINDKRMAVVTGIDLTIENNIQAANVLAHDEAVELIPGRINASGTLTAYFENLDLISMFVNEEEAEIEITMGPDGPGTYILKFPRVKFSTGSNPADGEGAIMLSMSYQALLDECTGTNIIIERIPLEADVAKPCSMTWSATALTESILNNGSFDSALMVTLQNKEFSGRDNLPLPGVTFQGLPQGLSGKVTRLSATKAKVEFEGRAAQHGAANSESVKVRFTGVAFQKGFCGCIGDAVDGAEQVVMLNFRDGQPLPANTLLTEMSVVAPAALDTAEDGYYIVDPSEHE